MTRFETLGKDPRLRISTAKRHAAESRGLLVSYCLVLPVGSVFRNLPVCLPGGLELFERRIEEPLFVTRFQVEIPSYTRTRLPKVRPAVIGDFDRGPRVGPSSCRKFETLPAVDDQSIVWPVNQFSRGTPRTPGGCYAVSVETTDFRVTQKGLLQLTSQAKIQELRPEPDHSGDCGESPGQSVPSQVVLRWLVGLGKTSAPGAPHTRRRPAFGKVPLNSEVSLFRSPGTGIFMASHGARAGHCTFEAKFKET